MTPFPEMRGRGAYFNQFVYLHDKYRTCIHILRKFEISSVPLQFVRQSAVHHNQSSRSHWSLHPWHPMLSTALLHIPRGKLPDNPLINPRSLRPHTLIFTLLHPLLLMRQHHYYTPFFLSLSPESLLGADAEMSHFLNPLHSLACNIDLPVI